MMQPQGVWVLYFCCNAQTAVSQSPLLGLCYSSITIVAASVILLLAMLLLTLFSSILVCKVILLMSCQQGRIALKDGPRQQCAVTNFKFTRSQLRSACDMFKPVRLKVGHMVPQGGHTEFLRGHKRMMEN
jgi:hypothetical protein